MIYRGPETVLYERLAGKSISYRVVSGSRSDAMSLEVNYPGPLSELLESTGIN